MTIFSWLPPVWYSHLTFVDHFYRSRMCQAISELLLVQCFLVEWIFQNLLSCYDPFTSRLFDWNSRNLASFSFSGGTAFCKRFGGLSMSFFSCFSWPSWSLWILIVFSTLCFSFVMLTPFSLDFLPPYVLQAIDLLGLCLFEWPI